MKKKFNITHLSSKLGLALVLILAVAFSACATPSGGDLQQNESDSVATVSSLQPTPAAVTTEAGVATTPPAVAVVTTSAATAPAVENPNNERKATESAVNESKNKDKSKGDKADTSKKKKNSDSKDKKSGKEKASSQPSSPTVPKPNDKPKPDVKPAPAPAPKPVDDTITVAISVDCATLYADDPDLAAQVSSKGVILSKKNVKVKKNATVYDALKASGVSFSGTQYISSIGGLSEFDGGPESGWVFLVSGVYSGVGVTKFAVKNGDYVQFRYTLKGGADVK
jgi:outer membrane biosynthesis protein TonB